MMKFNRIISYLLLLLTPSFPLFANETEQPIKICQNIKNHFNKQALAYLTQNTDNINIKIRNYFRDLQDYSNTSLVLGCALQVIVKSDNFNTYQDIGSAIIYTNSGKFEQFNYNLDKFSGKNATLYWGNSLPLVQKGFVDTSNSEFQIFNAILSNNDYVIFNYKGIKSIANRSTPTYLEPDFIRFINAMSQQIVSH